jgi:hypothetical protein
MLFYIEYGCSISNEHLVVDADNYDRADQYAEASAQDVYWSYDCNYMCDEDYEDCTEDEVSEIEYQDMLYDIHWLVEPYDETNENHKDAMHEQSGIPFEI